MANYLEHGYLETKYINKVLENNGFQPGTKGFWAWQELLLCGLSQTNPYNQRFLVLCSYLAQKLKYSSNNSVDLMLRRTRDTAHPEMSNKGLYLMLVHEVLEMEALDIENKNTTY